MAAPACPRVSEATPNPHSTAMGKVALGRVALGKVALGRQQQMEEAQPSHFLQFAGAQLPTHQPQSGETVLQLLQPGNPSHS